MASVRVAVRVRPLTKREKQLSSKVIVQLIGTTIFINKPLPALGDEVVDRRKAFSYDYSYDSTNKGNATYVSQDKIFQDLGLDVLKTAFEGFNACIFAYGQTGSGKSYTMMGDAQDKGVTPRICGRLLLEMDRRSKSDGVSFCTKVSYLEIYNERVQDLLRDKMMPPDGGVLKVREHPVDGPYVENLSKHTVHKHSDMEDLIALGNANRTTASTGMNKNSSRSHTIFTISFTQTWPEVDLPRETQSKIHLVDLAGSERVDATRATGTRLKEGGSINKSLVTLGSVISALADQSVEGQSTKKRKQIFIPYRDSVLTWLLKDSLGGNSVTTMIATISPADINYNETLSTLRYASRAKSIVNSPIVNEDGSAKVIRELQAEVSRLKGLLQEASQVPSGVKVKEELPQMEKNALTLTREWTCRWNESHIMLQEGAVTLRVENSGVVLDCRSPHLIGTDALGTGMALYYLKEGRTLIGSDAALCSQGIVQRGPGLLAEHCALENRKGVVTMFPRVGALCSVNGSLVEDACQLTHGCVTLLGAGTFLLFNQPTEAAQLRDKQKNELPSASPLSLTDASKTMLHNLSQTKLLPVETKRSNVSAVTPMNATATLRNHPNPHSCFELDKDFSRAAVSTRDGLEQEGDQCHKSGPELMSKWPLKAQSGAQVGTYEEEEARPGDASLQETSVLGLGDGCGTKPEGNTNKIQDVTADCCEERRSSGGSLLSRTSHPQSGTGAGSASVLPQTGRTSPKQPSSQTVSRPPERMSSEVVFAREAANKSGGACAMDTASVRSGSCLSSLVSRVSRIAQDAGQLLWSSATVLQQVGKRGIRPVGAYWSSYFVSLVTESRVLSVVNNSRVVSRVKGTLVLFLIRHERILSTLKGLPLLQHINATVVQNLQLEVAAKMFRDITQLPARVGDSPDLQSIPQDVCAKSGESWSGRRQRNLSQERVERTITSLLPREDVLFFRQTLITFPPPLLELQSLPLPDLLDVLQSATVSLVPALTPKVSVLYWLSVAKCGQTKPRPALLILAEAALYALTADSSPPILFCHLPLSELTEIHVGLAGLTVRLTGTAPDCSLAVYTHSQELTKEVCFSVLAAARPEDRCRVSEHPLMTDDLMTLSLDWRSYIPELQLGAGLRFGSHFQKSLADLAYLIYSNVVDNRLSLGDVHVLLYTSVGVCGGDLAPVAQFFLTDTHLGLLQQDVVFSQDNQSLFRDLAVRRCSDVRCVLVHDEDEGGAVRLDVVLARGHNPECSTEAATPSAHISDLTRCAEVWKLTFSCSSEAASLINHLSNESRSEQPVMNRAA